MPRIHRHALGAALTAFFTAVPASGQSFTYSPAGHETVDAGSSHSVLGSTSDGRVMLIDGELRGQARSLSEVAFRPHWAFSYYASGQSIPIMEERSWKSITLRIASCDLAMISPWFDANPTSTPTTVFQGPMRWPAALYEPTRRTLPFSIRFPFQTPWNDAGTAGVCLDFDFSGGSMSSNFPWGPGSSYSLSSFAHRQRSAAASPIVQVRGSSSCSDSSTPGAVPRASLTVETSGLLHYAPRKRNTVCLSTMAHGMRGPVVFGFGAGSMAGTTVPGISCAKLHLDPAASQFLGTLSYQPFYSSPFPFSPSIQGVDIWAQGAWLDSVTKTIKLSSASLAVIPRLPPAKDIIRAYIHQADPSQSTYGASWTIGDQPLIRYRH